MRVNLYAFSWGYGKGMTIDDLISYTQSKHGTPIPFGDHDRLLFMTKEGKYCLGLLITIRDQKRFCQMKSDKGVLKIDVRKIAEGSSIIDFNFFVVHRETGRGLYQAYSHSLSLVKFGVFMKQLYRNARDKIKTDAVPSLPKPVTNLSLQQLDKDYAGRLLHTPLYRTDGLKSLLAELNELNEFSFSYMTLSTDRTTFGPHHGCIQSERHTVRFNQSSPTKAMRDLVVHVKDRLGVKKGRVSGKDAAGIDKFVSLQENLDSFESYDFDDVAGKAVFDLVNVEKSTFFKDMMAVIRSKKNFFEMKAEFAEMSDE